MKLVWYETSTVMFEITCHCGNQRLQASVPKGLSGDIFLLLNEIDPIVKFYLNQLIFALSFNAMLTSRRT